MPVMSSPNLVVSARRTINTKVDVKSLRGPVDSDEAGDDTAGLWGEQIGEYGAGGVSLVTDTGGRAGDEVDRG